MIEFSMNVFNIKNVDKIKNVKKVKNVTGIKNVKKVFYIYGYQDTREDHVDQERTGGA